MVPGKASKWVSHLLTPQVAEQNDDGSVGTWAGPPVSAVTPPTVGSLEFTRAGQMAHGYQIADHSITLLESRLWGHPIVLSRILCHIIYDVSLTAGDLCLEGRRDPVGWADACLTSYNQPITRPIKKYPPLAMAKLMRFEAVILDADSSLHSLTPHE